MYEPSEFRQYAKCTTCGAGNDPGLEYVLGVPIRDGGEPVQNPVPELRVPAGLQRPVVRERGGDREA